MARLRVVPITQREAKEYIKQHHRHHKPPTGSIFNLAVALEAQIVGVAMVGRPVARMLDNGLTLEVNRVATDGTKNACSMLYGAAWRVALALGYDKLITYTLPEEGGASLKGAGFTLVGQRGGGSWDRSDRARVDLHPLQGKLFWEKAREVVSG